MPFGPGLEEEEEREVIAAAVVAAAVAVIVLAMLQVLVFSPYRTLHTFSPLSVLRANDEVTRMIYRAAAVCCAVASSPGFLDFLALPAKSSLSLLSLPEKSIINKESQKTK